MAKSSRKKSGDKSTSEKRLGPVTPDPKNNGKDDSEKPVTPSSKSQKNKQEEKQKKNKKDGIRETMEAFVMAFILAFLFRTFEAEAFVIPTGSMAPTLYGRHKEVNCDQCGHLYSIGASDELHSGSGLYLPTQRISHSTCPNCRFSMKVDEEPAYKGDRILVNKFPYELWEPERWDVIVFKYPEDPKTNYIKRLVGLPGEMIRIKQGDLYARKDNTADWEILRKEDPYKQKELQQLVYDNNNHATKLYELGWPKRWAGVEKSPEENAVAGWGESKETWTEDVKSHTFESNTLDDASPQWLRYRHFLPSEADWNAVNNGDKPEANPKPQLVTDFCGYNAYDGGNSHGIDHGFFWVGDLTCNARIKIHQVASGEGNAVLTLELVEGLRRYRCHLDLQTGVARLTMTDRTFIVGEAPAVEVEIAAANTVCKGAGTYQFTFANIDDRLTLFINGSVVEFHKKGEYLQNPKLEPGEYTAPAMLRPTDEDLTPVGIAARGLELTVGNLKIERDIYYRGERVSAENEQASEDTIPIPEYPFIDSSIHQHREYDLVPRLQKNLSNPDEWFELYSKYSNQAGVVFDQLDPDEFMVMGDNSPRSKDSRLWPNSRRAKHRHAVPRSALVGKAFFVYWPHGVPFMNDGKGYAVRYHYAHDGQKTYKTDYPSFRIPFYPYVSRMHRIR